MNLFSFRNILLLRKAAPVVFLFAVGEGKAQSGIAREFFLEQQPADFELWHSPADDQRIKTDKGNTLIGNISLFSRLPSFQPSLKSTGLLSWENRFATLQNPLRRSELVSTRLRLNSSVQMMGLPLQINGLFSTDNTSLYPVNFFQVRFDAHKYLTDQRNLYQTNVNSLQKKMNFRQILLEQLERAKREADTAYARAYSGMDHRKDSILKARQNQIKTASDSLAHQKKPTVPDIKPEMPDTSAWKQQAVDSVWLRKRENLERLRARKDSLTQVYDSLYDRFRQDSMQFEYYREMLNPSGSGFGAADSLVAIPEPLRKVSRWVNRLRSFQLGQAVVNYNELSLWGTNVLGVDAHFRQRGWGYGFTVGRALNNEAVFGREKPKYDQNLLGVKLEKTGEGQDVLGVSWFYTRSAGSGLFAQANQVISVHGTKTIRWFQLSGILAHSQADLYTATAPSPEQTSSLGHAWMNKAAQLKAKINLPLHGQLEGRFNYVGGAYKNMANPFLRKNFRELELRYQQSWLKSRLKTVLFYKDLNTLQNSLTETTNRVKGYGVQINSQFRKGLNFFFVLTPYEQGNNHPDTAFRTFNRNNLIIGGISYQKTFKKMAYFSQLSYSRSYIQSDRIENILTENWTSEHQLQVLDNHQFRMEFQLNQVHPNLDTLNFRSVQGQYLQTVRQHWKLGGSFRSVNYGQGKSIQGVGLNAEGVLFRTLGLRSQVNLDRISNWWGISGTRMAVDCSLVISYRW